MYLVINGEKGSYDRQIDITLVETFSTAEEAGECLRDILFGWLIMRSKDNALLEKLEYDYDAYEKQLKTNIRTKITKAIKSFDYYVAYNEYDGETYQVIYI
jgi:hypothetical protein